MQNPSIREKDIESEAREKAERTAEKAKNYAQSTLNQGEQRIKHMASEAERKLRQGEEQVRSFVSDFDRQLHETPWPLITGIAASCLLLGFIMGISKKSS